MPIIERAPRAGLLSRAHPVSAPALTAGQGQREDSRFVFFCETLLMSSFSALAGDLVKNIYCVFCERKMSSLARVLFSELKS